MNKTFFIFIEIKDSQNLTHILKLWVAFYT